MGTTRTEESILFFVAFILFVDVFTETMQLYYRMWKREEEDCCCCCIINATAK